MQIKVKIGNEWVEYPATTEIADDITSDKLTYSSDKIEKLVANKIDKSEIGDGLKFADGKLQLDIPTATANTTYGGGA
mgnify:CR=1 FL=1